MYIVVVVRSSRICELAIITLNIPNLLNRGLPPTFYTILATAYGLSIPSFEEIKTIDARQLWKTIAKNAGVRPDLRYDHKDYNLMDD